MQIFIKLPSGKTITMEMEGNFANSMHTISDIKEYIRDREGIDVDIMIEGTRYNNNKKITNLVTRASGLESLKINAILKQSNSCASGSCSAPVYQMSFNQARNFLDFNSVSLLIRKRKINLQTSSTT